MKKNSLRFLAWTILVTLLVFTAFIFDKQTTIVKAETSLKALSGYAWSSNIGWISFSTSTNGNNLVLVDADGLVNGYAWSDNIGWIKFGGLTGIPDNGYLNSTWVQQTPPSGSTGGGASAISSDGSKVVSGDQDYNGHIYTSTDFGTTWVQRIGAPTWGWVDITSSSDGTKLAAVADGDYIYTSTDSGVTWTPRTALGTKSWKDIASSGDGSKIAVLANYLYTSSDGGVTWATSTSLGTDAQQGSITYSADGAKLFATIAYSDSTNIKVSTDNGSTWTTRSIAADAFQPYTITASSDGSKLAVANMGDGLQKASGYVYTSTDGGLTWTKRISAGYRNWISVKYSADGTKLAAAAYNGYIYTSTDDGATWVPETAVGSHSWFDRKSIMFSADGNILFAYGRYTYYIRKPSVVSTGPGTNARLTGTALSGFARACAGTVNKDCNSADRTDGWDGWISLSGTGYGVDLAMAATSSFAWGSNVIGWISFNPQGGGVTLVDSSVVCLTDRTDVINVVPGASISRLAAIGGTVQSNDTGLTYNSSTGIISGTGPSSTTTASYSIVIFYPASGPCTASHTNTLRLNVSEASLPAGSIDITACKVGTSQCKSANGSLAVSKGSNVTIKWTVSAGANTCSGTPILGVPTEPDYEFDGSTVTVSDGPITESRSYSITCAGNNKKVISVIVPTITEF